MIRLGTSFSLGKVSIANSSTSLPPHRHLHSLTFLPLLLLQQPHWEEEFPKIVLRGRSLGFESEPKLASDSMESEKEFPELKRNLYPDIEPDSSGFLKVYLLRVVDICQIAKGFEATDNNSFSRSCSLILFFFENSVAKVSHASFGVLAFLVCSNMSSSTMVFKANMALPALIFYFCKVPLVSSSGFFLHGGPGGGTSQSNRRFFDPEFYRIILFDLRGAGKSTPHACLVENTTWDLISDIEKLREHLEIPEWQVKRSFLALGFWWVMGEYTLALAYSQSHTDKVTGIVLRGIFLLRKKEIDWFYAGGAAAIYPDGLMYLVSMPLHENIHYAAARAWTMWEMMTAHLLPNNENIKKGEDDKFSLAFARIENHYFVNTGFFPSDGFLLDNIDKVIPDAGHSANEPGTAAELVAATEKLKHIKKGQ
ncbi:proline iminopeptidase [Pyrus ussuriensis x Pyrus communis]|uniref:Proline iminopeptidase n=1 Tax=Pyrus ussuriensis x Pyrus communis TaxID=2448454 RepID=A0A5N5ICA0_9ROSA|nr:proline iminopeptidase [Pyrus ussuriensis x Pyrus communis]